MRPIKCCLIGSGLSRLRAVPDFSRNVHVYETDLMGIVHHSNYLRFCEEARVDWCQKKNIGDTGSAAVFALTVLETRVRHIKPVLYGDRVSIAVQTKIEGVRLFFQYRLTVNGRTACLAETIHCRLDTDFKVKRLSKELISCVEKEIWTETWL